MNLNLLVGKTLGLGKKKFYPISSVFIGSGKNILSYPQLTAYYLSNLNKTEPFFYQYNDSKLPTSGRLFRLKVISFFYIKTINNYLFLLEFVNLTN